MENEMALFKMKKKKKYKKFEYNIIFTNFKFAFNSPNYFFSN